MIIGLTGGYGSGKDVVGDYFTSKGFIKYSLSDIIREHCLRDGLELTRDNLIKKGNELRKKFGPWILAKLIKEKIDPKKDYIIVSIRNPAEVNELKGLKNFYLVKVEAPEIIRFNRVNSRARDGELYSSLQDFIAKESEELISKNSENQNLNSVFSMASIIVRNPYKTQKELYFVLDKLYSDLKNKKIKQK